MASVENSNDKLSVPSSQRNIPSLDGLRAISIVLVIIDHLSVEIYSSYSATFTRIESIVQEMFLVGHLGVTVFFVISGFLITSLLLKEKSIDLKKFYFRRTLRIFPPYYVYLLGILATGALGLIHIDWYNTAAAFTYTKNYFFHDSAPDSWYLAHTWSLCVEEQFYLILPATLLILGKKRGFVVVGLVLAICPVFRVLHVLSDPSASVEFGRFETVADALAIGCLLARGREWLHCQRWYSRLIRSNIVLLAAPIAVVITWWGNFSNFCPKAFYVAFVLTIQNICIALFLDFAVTNNTGTVGRFLNLRPVAFLGIISYSVYLWQQPFINSTLPVPIAVEIVLVFAAALLSFYGVERPALGLRRLLEQKHSKWQRKLARQAG